MFVWDETDFITCLETVPVVEEYGVSHAFTVMQNGLRLEIVVCQYDGDVSLRLFRDGIETPVIELDLLNCPGARYVNDETGERLEFAAATWGDNRYNRQSPPPYGVSVAVKPHIRMRLAGYDV